MFKITSKGIPELMAWLESLGRGVKTEATRGVTEYLVGDQSHGLKHYAMYQYVSMQKAYGGFVSDKQRRYVMAMIKEGKIDPGYPHRTGEMQRGWTYSARGSVYTIRNETPYTKYVMGDEDQSNMHRLIGWRKTAQVIQDNLQGAFRHAVSEVKKWLAEQRAAKK